MDAGGSINPKPRSWHYDCDAEKTILFACAYHKIGIAESAANAFPGMDLPLS